MQIELDRARESLLLLKKTLGSEKIVELFSHLHEETVKTWKQWVEASNGETRKSSCHMQVNGITPAEMFMFFGSAAKSGDQPWQYKAHPEHYGFVATPKGPVIHEVFGHGYLPGIIHMNVAKYPGEVPEGSKHIFWNMCLPDQTQIGTAFVLLTS